MQRSEQVFAVLGENEGYAACTDEVAKTLGIAPSSVYGLIQKKDFSTLHIGNRMVVPKEKFIQWVEEQTNGGAYTRENETACGLGTREKLFPCTQ